MNFKKVMKVKSEYQVGKTLQGSKEPLKLGKIALISTILIRNSLEYEFFNSYE